MATGANRYNFLVKYKAIAADGRVIKEGTIIAKMKMSKFEALAGTEEHLKKTIPGCVKIVGTAEMDYGNGDLLDAFFNMFPHD